MRLTSLLAVSLGLIAAACQSPVPTSESSAAESGPILASDLLLRKTTARLDFRWSAPAEAALEPALFHLLRQDGERALKDVGQQALEAADAATAGNYPFHGHEYVERWSGRAETPGLLALSSEIYTYTGGAHGGLRQTAALFDRATGTRIGFADLFISADDAYQALRQPWCEGLDEERVRKRAGMGMTGNMGDCPDLKEQVIVPVGEGRVDYLLVLVDPYVAGPWSEGSYQVAVPVEPVRALLKTAYVQDFAPS